MWHGNPEIGHHSIKWYYVSKSMALLFVLLSPPVLLFLSFHSMSQSWFVQFPSEGKRNLLTWRKRSGTDTNMVRLWHKLQSNVSFSTFSPSISLSHLFLLCFPFMFLSLSTWSACMVHALRHTLQLSPYGCLCLQLNGERHNIIDAYV